MIFKLLSWSFWSHLESSSSFHNQWKINWQDKNIVSLTNQQHLRAKELMKNENSSNGAVSQRIMHGPKSRKLHYAKQIAWNLPMYKINGFSTKPNSSRECSALLEIRSHPIYSIFHGRSDGKYSSNS